MTEGASGTGIDASRRPRRRDASRTRDAILQAALDEFSEHGHSGARVDRIARRAGVSKPLIYDYFGDKDAVYAAALREAYVQIRQAEQEVDLDNLAPDAAVRELARFTMRHFLDNPYFVLMLNTENLRGGTTVRTLGDAAEVQSVLVKRLRDVLARGAAEGVFRADVDPVEFYITLASLCWFPVSNRHTLGAIFHVPLDRAWYERRAEEVADTLILHLSPKSAPQPAP